jgi:hypothetical protein
MHMLADQATGTHDTHMAIWIVLRLAACGMLQSMQWAGHQQVLCLCSIFIVGSGRYVAWAMLTVHRRGSNLSCAMWKSDAQSDNRASK